MSEEKKKMKTKSKIRLAVDLLMTLALLFLMGYQLWGEEAHEWAGTGMLVLFIAHHLLNPGWHRNLFRGKYTGMRALVTAVDLVLLAVMLCLLASGIRMSRHVFVFLPIDSGMGTARLMHMAACYWGFVLMALHLGLHWGMALAGARKMSEKIAGKTSGEMPGGGSGEKASPGIRALVLRLLGAGIACYGLYAFVRRGLATYMFLRTEFVFLDYSESPITFYIDYAAMMGLFIWIAYYLSRILQKHGKQKA